MPRERRARQKQRQIEIIEGIEQALGELESLSPSLSRHASNKTRELLTRLKGDMERVAAILDPVKEPTKWFDPSDPNQAGRLIAAALIAQPRVPLDRLSRAYGAGVYAIYYQGDHPAYAAVSGTETPVYVGKANPDSDTAQTAREQGERLTERLADHRKMIRTVEAYALEHSLPNPLRIAHFTCRRLVTATHAQLFAEAHLINTFTPIWNAETRICWGISMHGDTAGRNNPAPPWDVMHPGRAWSMPKMPQDTPAEQLRITSALQQHFAENPPYRNRDEIIESFLDAFAQDPLVASEPVPDDDAPIADDPESESQE